MRGSRLIYTIQEEIYSSGRIVETSLFSAPGSLARVTSQLICGIYFPCFLFWSMEHILHANG